MRPAVFQYGSSEYLRQHFTADILVARLRVGQNAAGRRDDGDAKAVADPRELLATRINAPARLGNAGQMPDCGLALEIFQLDAQALGGAHRFFAVTANIAFALEHV